MTEPTDPADLQRRLEALQAAHPELDPLATLVLLALREFDLHDGTTSGMTTARLSRHLGIEHALVRRAAADLEARGWLVAESTGGASPALRLRLVPAHPPNE